MLISASVRPRSFLNARTPMLRSMCQGGITRASTFALIALRELLCVRVREERHRRDRVRLMADLALLLEDRRHVLAERHRFTRGRRRLPSRRRDAGDGRGAAQRGDDDETTCSGAHDVAPAAPMGAGLRAMPARSGLAVDRHFHESVGPAALRVSRARYAGIVGADADDVLARRLKRRRACLSGCRCARPDRSPVRTSPRPVPDA